MRKLILSASSIGAFKSCPVRFRNAYVYGIRKIEDSESQRIGTFWHLLLETVALVPGSECPECEMNLAAGDQFDPEQCPICEGTGKVPDDIMEAVTRVLNKAYMGKEFAHLNQSLLLSNTSACHYSIPRLDIPCLMYLSKVG